MILRASNTRKSSVTIFQNEWYHHSQGKGGGSVDFMMEFYGMTFKDAVRDLLNGEEPCDGMVVENTVKPHFDHVEKDEVVADDVSLKQTSSPQKR